MLFIHRNVRLHTPLNVPTTSIKLVPITHNSAVSLRLRFTTSSPTLPIQDVRLDANHNFPQVTVCLPSRACCEAYVPSRPVPSVAVTSSPRALLPLQSASLHGTTNDPPSADVEPPSAPSSPRRSRWRRAQTATLQRRRRERRGERGATGRESGERERGGADKQREWRCGPEGKPAERRGQIAEAAPSNGKQKERKSEKERPKQN